MLVGGTLSLCSFGSWGWVRGWDWYQLWLHDLRVLRLQVMEGEAVQSVVVWWCDLTKMETIVLWFDVG